MTSEQHLAGPTSLTHQSVGAPLRTTASSMSRLHAGSSAEGPGALLLAIVISNIARELCSGSTATARSAPHSPRPTLAAHSFPHRLLIVFRCTRGVRTRRIILPVFESPGEWWGVPAQCPL
jgi:hypothetical protein